MCFVFGNSRYIRQSSTELNSTSKTKSNWCMSCYSRATAEPAWHGSSTTFETGQSDLQSRYFLCIGQFQLRPAPPFRATARHLPVFSVPGVGHLQIFVLPGGRAFANPGAIPEPLTRTRFPIRI